MKVLLLVTALPRIPLDGVTIPIDALLPLLAERAEVAVGAFETSEESKARALSRGASRIIELPKRSPHQILPLVPPGISDYYSGAAQKIVMEDEYDLVVAHRLHTAFVGRYARAPRRTLIIQDLLSQKFEQNGTRSRVFNPLGRRWYRKIEAKSFLSFSSFHVVSEEERQKVLKEHGDDRNVVVSANGVSRWAIKTSAGWERPVVGYFGNLRQGRNVDALSRLRRILSTFDESERPTLRVVGSGASAALASDLESAPGIEFVGECMDPEQELSSVSLLVNPQQVATGIKNSVLEPMTGGHLAIVSDAIAKGIEVEDGVHARVCETDIEFREAIVESLENPTVCFEIGQRGARYVLDRFTWDSYADDLFSEVVL